MAKIDLEETCSTDQLACGLKTGVEGAIHALSDVFDDNKKDGCGMLMLDASNASTRSTVKQLCVMLENCGLHVLYFSSILAEVSRRFSFFYGVSLLPLIRKLKDPKNVLQTWYADDSAAIAKLKKLEIWLTNLIKEGLAFGYFPEPSKSFLVVDKQYAEEAHHIFDKYLITIVEGLRFLGAFIGD